MLLTRSSVALTLLVLGVFLLPISASAATKAPTCSLTVTTANGTVTPGTKDKILLAEGDTINIEWKSKNAKIGTDTQKGPIQLQGTASYKPKKTTLYSYRFTSGSKKVDCSFTAVLASGTIDKSTLTSGNSKPTIQGTANGTKTVRVIVRDSKTKKTVYTSKDIKVAKGTWRAKLPKALKDGAYSVELLASKDLKLNTLTTGSFTVGTVTAANASSFSVSSIPLLFGGTATAGSSVPVTYLKVANTSQTPSTMNGLTLKQYGSAPTGSVIGFTTSDDKGGSQSTLGGIEGSTPFAKDGTVFIPLKASFEPGQFRIFTVKAMVSRSAAASAGKNLMLDVQSIDTDGRVAGVFPVRGTTWTLSY